MANMHFGRRLIITQQPLEADECNMKMAMKEPRPHFDIEHKSMTLLQEIIFAVVVSEAARSSQAENDWLTIVVAMEVSAADEVSQASWLL